jgi:hypothetical protein
VAKPADLLHQAAELTGRAAALLEAGKVEEATRLQQQSDVLMRRARSAMSSAMRSTPRRSAQPGRELAISALAELEVPSSPKLVSAYAEARFSSDLRPSAFASIRRDEERAWRSPRTSRAVYLAPALDAGRFLPLRGLVTLSDWDLWRRLVGPRSARVDHLRATRAVARYFAWLKESGAEALAVERMARLLTDLSRTLPSIDDGFTTPEPDEVVRAVEAELLILEEDDRDLRVAAADRARQQLDDAKLLWGAEPLRALGGAEGA